MRKNRSTETPNPMFQEGPEDCARTVAKLLDTKFSDLDVVVSPSGLSFRSTDADAPAEGILCVRGQIENDAVLVIQLQLLKACPDVRIPAGAFFEHLSQLDDRCRLLKPKDDGNPEEEGLWAELRVAAEPMGMTRESAFLSQLEQLEKLACDLQREVPVIQSSPDLQKRYGPVAKLLSPVEPWQTGQTQIDPSLLDWARQTMDFIEGKACVALETPFPAMEGLCLSLLSLAASERSQTLGRVKLPLVNAKVLLETCDNAPGIVVVPAVRMSLATSAYELGNEIKGLLSTLAASGHCVLFTGAMEELQTIFSGGQGGTNDPLHPIVRHAPDVPLSLVARHVIRSCAQTQGGLPPQAEDQLTEDLLKVLSELDPAAQRRVLPMLAARTVSAWSSGKALPSNTVSTYVSDVSELTETLAGLSPTPRASRSRDVQEQFIQVLTDPSLLSYLKEELLGQDEALDQLASRLHMECLTRPIHQPLRYCAQGTPGTGKSQSAVLIAQALGIPYICIDAASMPDYYSAAAQLLGSGRGIVGSYRSGRLEQAAKHHQGVLVEVSDLDHAPPHVRSVLADLFLQILETGEGQSAAGSVFSCANLIFAFTMNLPGGLDESIRKNIGFDGSPNRRDVALKVETEIKRMLSGAFLSRVGRPVIFDPLNEEALAAIIERTIETALRTACERTQLPLDDLVLEEGLGDRVVASLTSSITAFGARALLQHSRSLASEAFLRLREANPDPSNPAQTLVVHADENGKLTLEPVKAPQATSTRTVSPSGEQNETTEGESDQEARDSNPKQQQTHEPLPGKEDPDVDQSLSRG